MLSFAEPSRALEVKLDATVSLVHIGSVVYPLVTTAFTPSCAPLPVVSVLNPRATTHSLGEEEEEEVRMSLNIDQ